MNQLYCETTEEWREWLQNNHDKSIGVSLILFYENSGSPSPSDEAAIEEALCFGWVNSPSGEHNSQSFKNINSEKYAAEFTPIKDTSRWSAENKKRAEKLIEENRMTEFGLAKIEIARRHELWYTPVRLTTTPITLLVLVLLYIVGGFINFAIPCMLGASQFTPAENISVMLQILAVFITGLLIAFPVTLNLWIPLWVASIEPPSALADYAKITWVLVIIGFMILTLVFHRSLYFSVGAVTLAGGLLYLVLIVFSAVQLHKWRVQSEKRSFSRTDMWNYVTQVLAMAMTSVSIVMGFFIMRTDNFPWSC